MIHVALAVACHHPALTTTPLHRTLFPILYFADPSHISAGGLAVTSVVMRDNPHLDFEDVMEFRLTYEGPLLSSQDRHGKREIANANHKHCIRKNFHPQLKRLWTLVSHFKDWKVDSGASLLEDLSANYPLGPYRFVPLVTERFTLVCSLNILMLRGGGRGGAAAHGDIDNRFKTLLDALKRPTQMDQLGDKYQKPSAGEDPFFVLLEDDKLVDRLTVEADALLEPTGKAPEDCVQELLSA